MPLSPKELMKGNIVSYEGRPRIVKGVMDYVILEGTKEWIGASLMNGEPITEVWLEKMSFENKEDYFFRADPTASRVLYIYRTEKPDVWMFDIESSSDDGSVPTQAIMYIHELQILFFAITQQHLPTPKLPKL